MARTRRAPAITVTPKQLRSTWNTLFDIHPWLDGLTAKNSCEDVFCCPGIDDPNYLVLSEISGILFLATGSSTVTTLTRDLVPGSGSSTP